MFYIHVCICIWPQQVLYCYSHLAFDVLIMHQYCRIMENVNRFPLYLENKTCFEDPENQCPSEERFVTEKIHAFTHGNTKVQ